MRVALPSAPDDSRAFMAEDERRRRLDRPGAACGIDVGAAQSAGFDVDGAPLGARLGNGDVSAHFRAQRLSSGRRAGLVMARPDGSPWRKDDWDNGRERVWQPLAVGVGLGRYVARPNKPA
jgi:hypothetical protein